MGGHERAAPIGIPRHGGRVDAAARPAAHATEHGAPVVPLLPAAVRRAALGGAHAGDGSPWPMAGSPPAGMVAGRLAAAARSAEHTSELQSLMRISYVVCCLKKHNNKH